jgi:hypothetical protein
MIADPDRELERALRAAEASSDALAWRQLCAALEGPLRVLVAGTDQAALSRAREVLRGSGVEPQVWLALNGPPRMGVVEHLRSCHAWIWVTPWTAALSTTERDLLAEARQAGAPQAFALALDGGHLLERMSDDPDRERLEVLSRLAALEAGPARDLREVEDLLDAWRGAQPELSAAQRAKVGALLRAEVQGRLASEAEAMQRQARLVQDQLDHLEGEVAEARSRALRVVNHLAASVRRHTAELLIDLRNWLITLEADLPAQIAAVPDTEALRRALPHWLQHLVEQWMIDRLGSWRAAVLADLRDLELDPASAPVAELLVPALHPGPLEAEADWTRRLGTTAALGGAAALFAFGQWAPGLVLLGAGLAFSSVRRGASEAQSRDRLRQTAEQALRALAADAPASLDAQLASLLSSLEAWPAQVEQGARAERAAAMGPLRERLEQAQGRRRSLLDRLQRLDEGGHATEATEGGAA